MKRIILFLSLITGICLAQDAFERDEFQGERFIASESVTSVDLTATGNVQLTGSVIEGAGIPVRVANAAERGNEVPDNKNQLLYQVDTQELWAALGDAPFSAGDWVMVSTGGDATTHVVADQTERDALAPGSSEDHLLQVDTGKIYTPLGPGPYVAGNWTLADQSTFPRSTDTPITGYDVTMFVSMNGDDNNSGTFNNPKLTLNGALSAIDDAPKRGNIELGPGDFTTTNLTHIPSGVQIKGASVGNNIGSRKPATIIKPTDNTGPVFVLRDEWSGYVRFSNLVLDGILSTWGPLTHPFVLAGTPSTATAHDFIDNGTGAHDGIDDQQTTMTDSGEAFTPSALIGKLIRNTTKGVTHTITANTATTISHASVDIADAWDTGDTWEIADEIIRPAGSFVDDGFYAGKDLYVQEATDLDNNGQYKAQLVTDLIITLNFGNELDQSTGDGAAQLTGTTGFGYQCEFDRVLFRDCEWGVSSPHSLVNLYFNNCAMINLGSWDNAQNAQGWQPTTVYGAGTYIFYRSSTSSTTRLLQNPGPGNITSEATFNETEEAKWDDLTATDDLSGGFLFCDFKGETGGLTAVTFYGLQADNFGPAFIYMIHNGGKSAFTFAGVSEFEASRNANDNNSIFVADYTNSPTHTIRNEQQYQDVTVTMDAVQASFSNVIPLANREAMIKQLAVSESGVPAWTPATGYDDGSGTSNDWTPGDYVVAADPRSGTNKVYQCFTDTHTSGAQFDFVELGNWADESRTRVRVTLTDVDNPFGWTNLFKNYAFGSNHEIPTQINSFVGNRGGYVYHGDDFSRIDSAFSVSLNDEARPRWRVNGEGIQIVEKRTEPITTSTYTLNNEQQMMGPILWENGSSERYLMFMHEDTAGVQRFVYTRIDAAADGVWSFGTSTP